MGEQDNEVMSTNFDSNSDDAHSSSEEEDNDDEEMYRSISIFTPVKTFHLYPFCSLLFLTQFCFNNFQISMSLIFFTLINFFLTFSLDQPLSKLKRS